MYVLLNAGKLALQKKESKSQFVAFSDFYNVNGSTMVNLKLWTWHYWTETWKDIYVIGSWELVQAGSSKPPVGYNLKTVKIG